MGAIAMFLYCTSMLAILLCPCHSKRVIGITEGYESGALAHLANLRQNQNESKEDALHEDISPELLQAKREVEAALEKLHRIEKKEKEKNGQDYVDIGSLL